MGRNSEPGPSFYKFLIDDDFTCKLRIPSEFVKNYAENLPSKTTLTTDLSGKSKSWKVKIERIGHHQFFTEGWSKFAEDVDLKHREYLLFKFVRRSAFNVSVYEITGCKKDSYSAGDRQAGGPMKEKKDLITTQEGGTSAVKSWIFSKELKHYNFLDCRLTIPKCFAIGTGIAKRRKIQLQDAKGRKWPVNVTGGDVNQFSMTAGWKNFLIGNKVKVGTMISFEFIPSSGDIVKARMGKELKGKPPLMIKL